MIRVALVLLDDVLVLAPLGKSDGGCVLTEIPSFHGIWLVKRFFEILLFPRC